MFLNRKINLFIFDVDGTLMKNGVIPESTKNVIEEIREDGDLVILATGRCMGMLDEVSSQIKFDGVISNNGAYCQIGKEVIFESQINPETINTIINDESFSLSLLTKDRFIRYKNTNKEYSQFMKYFNIEGPKKANIETVDKEKFYSLGVYSSNPDSVDQKKYKDLQFIKVCPYGFDVLNKGITKATAFSALREVYKGKFIAFGDNLNDIAMLKEADLSVAMYEAPDEVKRAANFTTRPFDDDGIEFAVDNFVRRVLE